MPKTMKLLWSTKSKINKDKNGENVPHLEITEDSRIKNQESRVLYTFASNKSFSQLLDISPKKIYIFKNF